jgi:hypothetical protein
MYLSAVPLDYDSFADEFAYIIAAFLFSGV